MIRLSEFIAAWDATPFGRVDLPPWGLTASAPDRIDEAITGLSSDFRRTGNVAIHRTATIEPGAVVKGPAIVGAGSFVAAGAYLRGGVFLDRDCVVGPGCELKSTFMLAGAKLAHLAFVGDSLVGSRVNVEAGAVVANHRNELDDRRIRIVHEGRMIDTGVEKFGALIGDDVRIGANAVVAPGALLAPGSRVGRLELVDQRPDAPI